MITELDTSALWILSLGDTPSLSLEGPCGLRITGFNTSEFLSSETCLEGPC